VTYTASAGWFSDVNGHAVVHVPLSAAMLSHATSWADKGPHGIVWHYQAGCGGDLTSVQNARGFPIIAFNIDQSGVIRQYMDARIAPWHAFDVSKYALGVEHAILPGTCDVNATMLASSSALFAALIEWTKDTYGIDIPVKKIGPITPANYRTLSGIFGHLDIEPGSSLNPNRHGDTLLGMTWPEFLAAVESEDDVTPEQAQTIKDAQAFLTALTKGLGQIDDPSKSATPTGAGTRVARGTLKLEKGPLTAYIPHDHTDGGQPRLKK